MPQSDEDLRNIPLEEILTRSHDGIINEYEARAKKYVEMFDKRFTKGQNYGTHQNSKYSNELVTSFRSACEAKDRLGVGSRVPYTSIAKVHKITTSLAYIYRSDYTLRPDCLPTEELIQRFIKQYQQSTAEIRAIKSLRVGKSGEVKPATKVLRKKKTYTTSMKLLKQHNGHFPQDYLDALFMLRAMYLAKRIKLEVVHEVEAICAANLPLFVELKKEEESQTEEELNV